MSKPKPDKKPPHGLTGRTGRTSNAWKPVAQKVRVVHSFRSTTAEAEAWEKAAKSAKMKNHAWIRETLNKEAGHKVDP